MERQPGGASGQPGGEYDLDHHRRLECRRNDVFLRQRVQLHVECVDRLGERYNHRCRDPRAPTNVTASATSTTSAALSWTAAAGATSYQIYYSNGFQNVLIGTVSSRTTSVTISGLSPGTTSYFAVVATNGTSQAASNWAAVTTPSFSAARLADLLFAQSATQSQAKNWLL